MILSLSGIFRKMRIKKRKETLLHEAAVFMNVHFVREHAGDRYSPDKLRLMKDPEAMECLRWYSQHPEIKTFADAVAAYMKKSGRRTSDFGTKYRIHADVLGEIANNPDYEPTKGTVAVLCFAFRLTLPHAKELLAFAGYTLSNSRKSDLIIRYCLENKIYSLQEINYLMKKLADTDIHSL